MRLCRCGKVGRSHEVTDACLTAADQEVVRRFAAAYDEADLGPWWHQAAGRQPAAGAAGKASSLRQETTVADQTYESSREIRPGDVVEDAHGSLFLRATGSNWVSLRGAQEPQSRERALLLASRVRTVGPPPPTHAATDEPDGLFGPGRSRWRSIAETRPERAGWELHYIRGAGMAERSGPRPGRRSTETAFCVMAWKDSRQVWRRGDATSRYTIEDALAFQTFRPDYPVVGSSTRAHEQIGNAVPPLLATHVVAAVVGAEVPALEVAA